VFFTKTGATYSVETHSPEEL